MTNERSKLLTAIKNRTKYACPSCGYTWDFATNKGRDSKTGLADPASARITRMAWMIGKWLLKKHFTRKEFDARFPGLAERTWRRDLYTLTDAGFVYEVTRTGRYVDAYRFVTFRDEAEAA